MIRTGLLVSAIIITVCLGLSLFAWIEVPADARIPVHFDANGTPDRFGGKLEALFALPAVMVGVTAIMTILPSILPRRAGLKASGSAYIVGWIGAMLVVAAGHAMIVAIALGYEAQPGWIMYPVSLLIIAVGNAVAKTRSNWAVGLRTPWSLSSEDAWVASNRALGWGFVLSGLASLAGQLLIGLTASILVLTGGVLAGVIVATAISYQVWRREQAQA